jgi:hypothetical protein
MQVFGSLEVSESVKNESPLLSVTCASSSMEGWKRACVALFGTGGDGSGCEGIVTSCWLRIGDGLGPTDGKIIRMGTGSLCESLAVDEGLLV